MQRGSTYQENKLETLAGQVYALIGRTSVVQQEVAPYDIQRKEDDLNAQLVRGRPHNEQPVTRYAYTGNLEVLISHLSLLQMPWPHLTG